MQAKKRQNSMQDKNLMPITIAAQRKTSRRPSKFKNRRVRNYWKLSARNGTQRSIDKELKWRLRCKKQMKRGKGALPSNSKFEGLIRNKKWSLLSCFRPGVFEFGTSYRKSVAHMSATRPWRKQPRTSPTFELHIIKKHPSSIFLSVARYFDFLGVALFRSFRVPCFYEFSFTWWYNCLTTFGYWQRTSPHFLTIPPICIHSIMRCQSFCEISWPPWNYN